MSFLLLGLFGMSLFQVVNDAIIMMSMFLPKLI